MTPCSSYTLGTTPAWNPAGWGRRRLMIGDRPLPVFVNGDDIGLQLRCGAYTLLATNYDYFDACSNWIYLLGEDGKPVDQLRLPDYFGFIQAVEVRAPNEITFGYLGTEDRWRLVVHRHGFRSCSFPAMRRRPNRFLFARRYLSVERSAA